MEINGLIGSVKAFIRALHLTSPSVEANLGILLTISGIHLGGPPRRTHRSKKCMGQAIMYSILSIRNNESECYRMLCRVIFVREKKYSLCILWNLGGLL